MDAGGAPLITGFNGITRIRFDDRIYTSPKPKAAHQAGAGTFGVVYVNDAAREAMLSEQPTKFPVGSIIVREKLAGADYAQPELLAVMVKRARGFNPKAGDWEFLTIDGAIRKIQERQKRGSCLQCHASQSERDFVFPVPAAK